MFTLIFIHYLELNSATPSPTEDLVHKSMALKRKSGKSKRCTDRSGACIEVIANVDTESTLRGNRSSVQATRSQVSNPAHRKLSINRDEFITEESRRSVTFASGKREKKSWTKNQSKAARNVQKSKENLERLTCFKKV
jgi:hypothetical protein